jgi:hypothetical protein
MIGLKSYDLEKVRSQKANSEVRNELRGAMSNTLADGTPNGERRTQN